MPTTYTQYPIWSLLYGRNWGSEKFNSLIRIIYLHRAGAKICIHVPFFILKVQKSQLWQGAPITVIFWATLLTSRDLEAVCTREVWVDEGTILAGAEEGILFADTA